MINAKILDYLIRWTIDFLNKREFYVNTNGFHSAKHDILTSNWLNNWRLEIAPQKCQEIVFSKCTRKIIAPLIFCDQELEQIESVKFLGVTFDRMFNFNIHIKNLITEFHKRLNITKIISHKTWYLKKKTLVNTYCSLIRSIIDYSAIITNEMSSLNVLKLQRVQNCALRVIF